MTKAQYRNGRTRLYPPSIGSHSDQQFQTQTCGIFDADMGYTGWHGRLGDYFFGSNVGLSTFTNVSLSGDNVIQVGEQVMPYSVNTNGQMRCRSAASSAAACRGGSTPGRRALLFGTAARLRRRLQRDQVARAGRQPGAGGGAGGRRAHVGLPRRAARQRSWPPSRRSSASRHRSASAARPSSLYGRLRHPLQPERTPSAAHRRTGRGMAAFDTWAQANDSATRSPASPPPSLPAPSP
jgi:hypothetical protein